MPRYDVIVRKERFYFATVTVNAGNEVEAHGEAIAQAVSRPDYLWTRQEGVGGVSIIIARRK